MTKILLSILFSGLCYYSGNGLSGDHWYLVWIAPIPLLYLSVSHSKRVTFTMSFTAYLIGRLSWFGYLAKVAPLIPAVMFTILPALIFAGIMLLSRSATLCLNKWYSLFIFPLFFAAYEYVAIQTSPHGTATSIAYSQMDCLPVIQIASITGIIGITFIVTLIPASIAYAFLFRKELLRLSVCTGVIIGGVLLFGALRITNTSEDDKIKAGLVVIKEEMHNTSGKPNIEKDKTAADLYLKQIDSLAAQGVSVILLPERALSIDKENKGIQLLADKAAEKNVYIIAGYTNLTGEKESNAAVVIDNKGNILSSYDKVHLIPGLESQFKPGKIAGLFKLNNIPSGIAICKDLDFQRYIRNYGGINILFVPAWDFVVDDWLHSHMAILRSVENGFSQVRTARTGQLTINDCYGRVLHTGNSVLIGDVPTKQLNTFYTRSGDWAGILCLLLSIVGYFLAFRRLKVSADIPK